MGRFKGRCIGAVLLSCTVSASALAQTSDKSEGQPSHAEVNPLAGPVVKERAEPRSLVSRDTAGKLVLLDQRPEAAAIGLVGLDAKDRAAAEKVLTERYEQVTRLLRENLSLFLQIQTARKGGGDASELAPLMRQFRPVAAPLVRPPLIDALTAVLPEDKSKELRRIVAEYVEAFAAEQAPDGRLRPPARATPMSAGDDSAPAIVPPQMEYRFVLREMGRVLATSVAERRERFDAFMKAIEATPEQETQIRALVRGNAPQVAAEPSAAQRAELISKIMPLLTPEQRTKATAFLRGS